MTMLDGDKHYAEGMCNHESIREQTIVLGVAQHRSLQLDWRMFTPGPAA